MGKIVTLTATLVEWKQFAWYTPNMSNCTLTDQPMPTEEQLAKAGEMFNDIEKAMQTPVVEGERPR